MGNARRISIASWWHDSSFCARACFPLDGQAQHTHILKNISSALGGFVTDPQLGASLLLFVWLFLLQLSFFFWAVNRWTITTARLSQGGQERNLPMYLQLWNGELRTADWLQYYPTLVMKQNRDITVLEPFCHLSSSPFVPTTSGLGSGLFFHGIIIRKDRGGYALRLEHECL
jgi:hypothetical protein